MATSSPFFSLVVPTYNRASLIGKTLQSLLQIAYKEFEIIVVDDGSTDDTRAVVDPFLSDVVKYYYKPNGERGAARNFGQQKAKGSYVNFFDSDDLALVNHLSEAAQTANRLNQPEVFALGYDVRNENGALIREVTDLPSPVNSSLITGNHLSANGVFLRKDVAACWPFSENRALSASEDYVLWMKLAARYDISFVPVITSTVVDHPSRSVVTINKTTFYARMEALQRELLEDDAFKSKFGDQWNKFRAYQEIYIALHLGMAGIKGSESLTHLWQAAGLYAPAVFTRRFASALKHCLS